MVAADDAVVVEGLYFLGLAGPDGAEEAVAGEAGAEGLAAADPAAC